MKYISHRGDLDGFIENTREAFESALRYPIHMIETDIRVSHDGEWIIFHDRTLSRILAEERWINELTQQELAQKSVLSLQETLDLIQGRASLYLDIKEKYCPETLNKLYDLLINCVAQGIWKAEQIYLASFNDKVVQYLSKHQSTGSERFKLVLISSNSYGCISKNLLDELDVIVFSGDVIDEEDLTKIRAEYPSLEIYVYVLNDLISLNYFKSLGVDGLLTDYPALFNLLEVQVK